MGVNRSPTNRRNESNTLVNALIGGVAGVVLSMVPFSPVLGGGIASYLNGGTHEDGLRIGALAGLVMLLPYLIFLPVALFMLGIAAVGPEFLVLLLVVSAIFGLYTVGLSALGGYLGIYVREEYA